MYSASVRGSECVFELCVNLQEYKTHAFHFFWLSAFNNGSSSLRIQVLSVPLFRKCRTPIQYEIGRRPYGRACGDRRSRRSLSAHDSGLMYRYQKIIYSIYIAYVRTRSTKERIKRGDFGLGIDIPSSLPLLSSPPFLSLTASRPPRRTPAHFDYNVRLASRASSVRWCRRRGQRARQPAHALRVSAPPSITKVQR